MTRDEKDNMRLRRDRAWKTAAALEDILQDGKIERFGMTELSEERVLPFKDYKGLVRKIHYRAAYMGKAGEADYPSRDLFKQEGALVQDILGSEAASVTTVKGNKDNDYRDRTCIIIFKRPIPGEVNQIVKQAIISNSEFPIFSYRKIMEFHKKSGEKRILFYFCPGQFILGPP